MYENMRQKDRKPIVVNCVDGEYLHGSVYLEPTQRLSDLMNDHRAFLPLEQEDGLLVVIAKTSIKKINEVYAAANQN